MDKPPTDIRFKLTVVNASFARGGLRGFAAFDALRKAKVEELRAGHDYQLIVNTTKDELDGSTPLAFSPSFTLGVRPQWKHGGDTDNIKIDDDVPVDWEIKDVNAFEQVFKFSVKANCPDNRATFILFYCLDDGSLPTQAAQTDSLVLIGSYSPEFRDDCMVALDSEPEDNVGIVHICAPASNKLLFKCCMPSRKVKIIESPNPPVNKVLDFLRMRVNEEYVRKEMVDYSLGICTDLMEWIQDQRLQQEDLCLVLSDHSDSSIPWEMLAITEDGRELLGAAVNVVRWCRVSRIRHMEYLLLKDAEHSGDVLAYHAKLQDTETAALDRLETQRCKTQDDLREWLKTSSKRFGLVYLACHGTFSIDKKHENTLELPGKPVRLISFGYPVGIAGERPVVFVNACHSGRLGFESGGSVIGFPVAFLQRFADGFIGALGVVSSKYAGKLAERILDEARTADNGIRPGEMLQRLRREAAELINDDQVSAAVRWGTFMTAFLFVYYGNPLARLKLTPRGEAVTALEDEHE